MHVYPLLLMLAAAMGFALVCGYVTHRLGLSSIVGYLLAGIAVGPYTPGFVADRGLAEQLAEVGVVLLMFGVGLHFHLEHLLAVRRVAVPGAIVQSLAATGLGLVLARLAGWTDAEGLVFGLALSVASTVVLMRVLEEHGDLHTQGGHVAVGWLVVEDLFTVVVLVLLPVLVGTDVPGPDAAAAAEGGSGIALALLFTALKIAVLVAVVFLVGGRVLPRLLAHVARTRSRELFTLTVLAIALGVAVGSASLFGVSMALGAFLAGMVVGKSEFSHRAATDALPMRDAFAVLFFVSVGMLFDPMHVVREPLLVLGTVAIVVVGKPLAALLIVRALGYPPRIALTVSAALAQIGEFSFILMALGRSLGVVSEGAANTVIAAAIVSITLNPLLYRGMRPLEEWIRRRPVLRDWISAKVRGPQAVATDGAAALGSHPASPAATHRAVVVGHGPVGRTVRRLLEENGIRVAVIDLNLDTVRVLRAEGVHAVYGDAAHEETLRAAGLADAGTLVLSGSAMRNADHVIRTAREIRPDVRVLARVDYVREVPAVRAAGAEVVFSGEAEVALAVTEGVLSRLGATPAQVERERERVRAELA